jgi:hypothetical protein
MITKVVGDTTFQKKIPVSPGRTGAAVAEVPLIISIRK